jgi:hypothetical protein
MSGMKRTLLLLVLASSAYASESFVLDIPVRGITNQETGKVVVSLTLDSAPAGSQLIVNGATTLNLGQTQNVGGDSVTFEAGSGNDVKITYVPLSNFSGDFCQGAAAVQKDIPLRFVGAQDVTDYRVSSYIVAAPNAECAQATKRTGDAPANIQLTGDGVAPALVATNRGRGFFDVALVLDKSGSMADLPPGAGPSPMQPSKADILRSAMDAFVAQWMQLDGAMPAGAEWPKDRMGVVQFDSTAHTQTLAGADPPANFFLQRGAGNAWNAVSANIDTLTPGSNTSIGDGINAAMQQWKNDPQSDFQIIVVTDGMQNTAPLIQPTGSGFLGLTPVAGLPQELRERFIPIHSIGFGAPAAVDAQLLANLALETAGVSFISINATTMFNALGMTLVAILKGNTAAIGLQRNETFVVPGPTAKFPVSIDKSVQRAVFSVQWAPPVTDALDLEVFPNGATTPATPTSRAKTRQAALQTFDMRPQDIGTWEVRVTGEKNRVKSLPYTLTVFFLEEHLDYHFTFDGAPAKAVAPGTGDSIRLRATLSWNGKPLTRLPAGAIRVRIQRPAEGLGNILRASKAGGGLSPAGDPMNAYQTKVKSITNAKLLERIMPHTIATVSLKEEGHGVYSAVFDKTTIPGTYGFDVTLDWTDKRTGHVHRIERLENTVKVKVDPAMSIANIRRPSNGVAVITVTPRDKFGNYLGPGFAPHIKVESRGKAQPAIDRDLNGTYTIEVRDLPEKSPITVSVDGVKIR